MRDLVELHQAAHAAGERFHDLVLALKHGREIETYFVQDDAVFGGFLFCENEMVARRKQRLARDTPDVETSAAEFGIFLDDGGLESELGRADGGNVAARAGTDDYNVIFIHGRRLAGGSRII